MTTPTWHWVPKCGRLWAKSVLAAVLVVALSAEAGSAPARFALVRLANSPSYSAAYSQVNKQLTVLQSKRTGQSRRAKCRNDDAIKWLSEQGKETASWRIAASEAQRNDALTAELKSELAIQSKLQPCKRRQVRRNG